MSCCGLFLAEPASVRPQRLHAPAARARRSSPPAVAACPRRGILAQCRLGRQLPRAAPPDDRPAVPFTGGPRRHVVSSVGAHSAASAAATPSAAGTYDMYLHATADAVERAGRLCVAVRQFFLNQEGASAAATINKADRTPVTIADFSVQALLSLELGARFPAIPLIAEEDSAELRAPGASGMLRQVSELVSRFGSAGPVSEHQVLEAIDRGVADDGGNGLHWVLDPIDGTKGFLDPSGRAQYVIGLALVDGTAAVLGVMGVPSWERAPLAAGAAPGLTVAASSGGGAWWRQLPVAAEAISQAPAGAEQHPLAAAGWQRCRADPAARVEEATICISDHEEWDKLPMARGLAPRSPRASKRLCCGSLCKYAAVALGDASAFVQHPVPGFPKLKVWDHAAGVVCVIEAGGAVTDFAGRPLALAPGRDFVPASLGVLASNGALAMSALPVFTSGSIHTDALRGIVLGSGGGGLLLPPPAASPPPQPRPAAAPAAASGDRLLVLLDRDGVINEDLGTWCMRVEDLRLIPGSAKAVAALNAAGHATAVVTNQSCVGRGLLSLQGLAGIHARLHELLAAEGGRVDCLLFADDHPEGEAPPSQFRKPNPGMLREAMEKLGCANDVARAVMIGDTVSDMKAAAALGVRRMMVCTGHGATVGDKAAVLGWTLPRTLSRGDLDALGGLVPNEVHPIELHADLASVVGTLLAPPTARQKA